MPNPDDYLFEYSVVRYVPRVDREEFINIGLVMLSKRNRWIKGRVMIDQARIKAFDPKANIETLMSQAAFFERNDIPAPSLPCEEKYRWLTAVKSAVLQVSPSHPGIIPSQNVYDGESIISLLEKEFDRLFTDLVML